MLASVGVITGGITLNSIVLGTLTTAGILLKSYHEFKNLKSKTDLLKFSLTSYEKVLTNLREAMRGGDFDYKEFIYDMKILDQEILDLSPPSYKFEKKICQTIPLPSNRYCIMSPIKKKCLRREKTRWRTACTYIVLRVSSPHFLSELSELHNHLLAYMSSLIKA